MPVRIRLARCGIRHNPEYYIHVANSYCARDGKYIERIGFFKANPDEHGRKIVMVDFSRAKYWLSRGAAPSFPVLRLFGIAGLLPEPPLHFVKSNKTT